jgi:ketosteroid isomerase-like protein
VSQADIATLQLVYADWARGDFSRVDVFAPEIEFVYSADFPDPQVFRGVEEMVDGWRRWLHEWHDVRLAAEEFIDFDPMVLVEVTLSGSGRGSGAPLSERAGNLWTFRDGKAVRLEAFASVSSARRAAGL